MEKVQVSLETLTKTAGLIEVVKGVVEKQEKTAVANRAAAEKVAKELADGGFMPAEKVAGLVDTLAADPAKGFGIISNFAKEAKAARAKMSDLEKKAAAQSDSVPSMGVADSAPARSKSASVKASDEAWNRGFPV